MTKKNFKYMIPNEDGTGYDEAHFSSNTGVVEEVSNKKYVTDEQENFLKENLNNILLLDMIVNNFSSNEVNKVASAQTVKKLYELLGGTKIVISNAQPSPEVGTTILWIDTSSTED
jgi:hypothetical protein